MNSFLKSALESLPAVSTSRYALVAYGLAIIAYLILGWRVSRNKNVLKHLEKLPEADRLQALQSEMNIVVPERITAEQWIKARTHQYYFLAFLVTLLILATIFVLVFMHGKGKLSISADIYPGPPLSSETVKTPEKNSEETNTLTSAGIFAEPARPKSTSSSIENTSDSDYQLRYEYTRDASRLIISPVMPYLNRLANHEYVNGVEYQSTPFPKELPILSIKVQNNTKQVVLLSELVIKIKKSNINLNPILVARSPGYGGTVSIINEGWGAAISPRVHLGIVDFSACEKKVTSPDLPYELQLEALTDYVSFSVNSVIPAEIAKTLIIHTEEISKICLGGNICTPFVPENITCLDKTTSEEVCKNPSNQAPEELISKLRKEWEDDPPEGEDTKPPSVVKYIRRHKYNWACVIGQIEYKTETGKQEKFRFKTLVSLGPPPIGARMPPSYQYDIFLPAGKSNYLKRSPISQQIKPGEADHFLVRIGSDKSALFDLDISLIDASGSTVWNNNVLLDLFVANSWSGLVQKTRQSRLRRSRR